MGLQMGKEAEPWAGSDGLRYFCSRDYLPVDPGHPGPLWLGEQHLAKSSLKQFNRKGSMEEEEGEKKPSKNKTLEHPTQKCACTPEFHNTCRERHPIKSVTGIAIF